MPRKHQRKPGSRNFKTGYSDETLAVAILEVKSKRLSITKAAKKFGISYGTLYNKAKGLHTKTPGGQIRLTQEQENLILYAIDTLSLWKIPLSGFDVRSLVKSFLDAMGSSHRGFKNNMPGVDWL